MKKILPVIIFYFLTFPTLSKSQIIEIGKCYFVDGYQTQNTWNKKDYINSNTLHYKFLSKPVRQKTASTTTWKTKDGETFLFEDDEIKYFQDLGYKKIKKLEKHVLSINLNNGIVTELKVNSNDMINYYRTNITKLIKLKKSFPNKWTDDKYGDEYNLDFFYRAISNKSTIEKYNVETYVDGLIIARNLEDIQYSNGRAIKINLNTMKYSWGFFDTIINEGDNYYCNKNYKNIDIKKNTINKKSNSGIRNLLKKLY
tara:strand:+ start:122 stop:889 length:768 start_codon:yes stop_codon:yes gene_type:complete